MSQLNPYLNYQGNCREAMTFYKDCIGGELTMQTVGESPMAAQMAADTHDKIMHSHLVKDGTPFLMASDLFMPGEFTPGNNISLSYNCSSEEEAKDVFSKLSAGGQVTHPLQVEFWGGLFGTLTDKFGIQWMVHFDKTQN